MAKEKKVMNNLVKQLNVEDMIYEIRGKQVMLDSDLASLYGVETKRINEVVKKNQGTFPDRNSWILNIDDEKILWSQNATANINNMSLLKKNNPNNLHTRSATFR
jgi:hypothetical protein